jgi:ABC-type transport system involved in multi-copper enzyme maturation permease subunit
MQSLRSVLAIARADFFERTRSYGFLVILALTVFSAWRLVPNAGSTRAPMHFDAFRALNTAAGIGATVATMCGLWLFFIGFYLVSNAVKRDEDTGVGQIIATTQVGKATYLFGKAVSNLAVLLAILGAVSLTLVLTLLVKGEGGGFDLVALWLPLWVLVTPSLALVAALAVVAEVLFRNLRGVINVAYFFFWTFVLMASMLVFANVPVSTPAGQITDMFAMRTVVEAMETDLRLVKPEHKKLDVQVNFPFADQVDRTFVFGGFKQVFPLWLWRFAWVGVAALLVGLVAVPFRRFDPAYRHASGGQQGQKPDRVQTDQQSIPVRGRSLALPSVETGSPFLLLLQSELRLMLHGRSRWWWLVTGGLLVATAVAPLGIAHRYVLPGLWFWHVLVLSRLGCREVSARTTEIVFAAPSPLARQLPAALGAGVALTLVLGLSVLLRQLLAGNPAGALGVVAGALFIPALALALGTWTNGSKTFEILFTVLWYGAMNDAPPMDFAGALASDQGTGIVLAYLGLGVAFTVLAVPGRFKQLRGL